MTMRSRQTGGHTIDVLFPLAVFFAFAASAVMAILLAANIYSSAVTGSERMYNASTALSYIREKVHQNDTVGAVQIEQLEGIDVLILKQTYNEQAYRTYIYAWDGGLRELFSREDLPFDPDNGRYLLDIQGFSCKKVSEQLLEVQCIDSDGGELKACIALFSSEGDA